MILAANPVVLLGHSWGDCCCAGECKNKTDLAQTRGPTCGVITLGTPHDLMRRPRTNGLGKTGYRNRHPEQEVLKQEISVLEDYIANTAITILYALASSGILFLGIHGTEDPAVGTESLDHLFAGVPIHSRRD